MTFSCLRGKSAYHKKKNYGTIKDSLFFFFFFFFFFLVGWFFSPSSVPGPCLLGIRWARLCSLLQRID